MSQTAQFTLDAATRWIVCGGAAANMAQEKRIFRTTDGGASWRLMSGNGLGDVTLPAGVPQSPSAGTGFIFFRDQDNGWLTTSSAGPNLYHTRDGGITWASVREFGSGGGRIANFSVSPDGSGGADTYFGPLITDDGGDTWRQAHTASPAAICGMREAVNGQPLVPDAAFTLNATSAWQVCNGDGGMGHREKLLFGTVDGGVTWLLLSRTNWERPAPEPGVGEAPEGGGVVGLVFLEPLIGKHEGFMGLDGPMGGLYRTHDGGVTWAVSPPIGPQYPIVSVTFTSFFKGVVVTRDGTFVTGTEGESWEKKQP